MEKRTRRKPIVPVVAGKAVLSERGLAMALLETESRFLELLSGGASGRTLLESLVHAIEALSTGLVGSVLLLSEDRRHIRHGVALHLPPAYCAAIDGLEIGPAVGSCGTAMYTGKLVIVSDIATDPLWKNYRKLALRHGLRSCWSAPILGPAGEVLGTFALYYRAPRRPSPHEVRLVQVAAQLAALAIGRDAPGVSFWPDTRIHLSARELQIIRLIAGGAPVKRIASGLNVSISTVYTHRARIFQKLNVDSNVGVAHYAATHHLL